MVNTFSFCLYGGYNERYYPGMIANITLAQKHFPDWKVFVWIGPDVEPDFIEKLKTHPNVVLRETGVTGSANMIHRFYTIDEPDVDLMMVRDADSIIHWKDRWAINEFVKSGFLAHTIRDNIEHTAPLMGGLWGIRKSAGVSLRDEYAKYIEDKSKGHRLAHDQNFLYDAIYPKVLPRLLVHYSNNRGRVGEHAVEFPFKWTNDIYCGRIEEGYIDVEPPIEQKEFEFRQPKRDVQLLKFLHRR
jgi:hypothetical protein